MFRQANYGRKKRPVENVLSRKSSSLHKFRTSFFMIHMMPTMLIMIRGHFGKKPKIIFLWSPRLKACDRLIARLFRQLATTYTRSCFLLFSKTFSRMASFLISTFELLSWKSRYRTYSIDLYNRSLNMVEFSSWWSGVTFRGIFAGLWKAQWPSTELRQPVKSSQGKMVEKMLSASVNQI